ncbi:hypothetical protein P8452_27127 [Trifolium repens]|nr:hypothetical protein P8452_27127 [Trifolium repens]
MPPRKKQGKRKDQAPPEPEPSKRPKGSTASVRREKARVVQEAGGPPRKQGGGCGVVAGAYRSQEKEEGRERSTLERLSFWRCSVGRVSWRAEGAGCAILVQIPHRQICVRGLAALTYLYKGLSSCTAPSVSTLTGYMTLLQA